MEFLTFIIVAYAAGFLAQKCYLPPLVGFLIAGFGLASAGYASTDLIEGLANLGVTLLLFTIGLKLDVSSLLKKEIWLNASIHNLATTAFFTLALICFKYLGLSMFAGLEIYQLALLGFALSFSSTVFAIKNLQEHGTMNANFAKIAIGILVMQDIIAVLFLTASTGKIPHWTAIFLFILPFVRPIFYRLLEKSGHGEMLVLYGFFMALVMGAGLFELVGMKPDLGALILGMLLAGHAKSSELSKALFNIKELFLVCFFLNIGLAQPPHLDSFLMALLLLLLLPFKTILYFYCTNFFRFRVRTSLLTSLTLTNFSEFGLIVAGIAYKYGWLPGELLATIALTVSMSFILAAPLNNLANTIYEYMAKRLKEHTDEKLHVVDQRINPGNAQVLILGMGRIGTGAYDELRTRFGKICLGIEMRDELVHQHKIHGRNVIQGDATDSDFWARILDTANVKLVLLSMPHNKANQNVIDQLQLRDYQGKIAAIAEYPDQVQSLCENGVDAAYNIYHEAGAGFARHVYEELKPNFSPMQSGEWQAGEWDLETQSTQSSLLEEVTQNK